MYIAIGFGTMVYALMLLIDKGLNDTMQSSIGIIYQFLSFVDCVRRIDNGRAI